MTTKIESNVEIYENERCWIGKGFGKQGLLPNDRGRYSTLDGSMSFGTAEEAWDALLSRGWIYKNSNKDCEDDNNTAEKEGEEGWMYARDFSQGAVLHAKPSRNVALHWVRFRILTRRCVFDPDQFISSNEMYGKSCDHGDSKAIQTLSTKLLQVLAYATLVHNTTTVTDAISLPLKARILNMLVRHQPTTENADAFYQLEVLYRKMQMFADNEHNMMPMQSMFSSLKPFAKHEQIPEFEGRCKVLSETCFSKEERNAIAGLVVRKLDPHFQLHCQTQHCGVSCNFQWVPCPNQGCPDIMSKLYLSAHNDTCAYKLVSCECGDTFPRNKQACHLSDVCPLRQAQCPFARIGCDKVIQAKDIPDHVAQETSSHLLLAVHRMMQHEQVIRDMNQKIHNLETENLELKKSLAIHKETSIKQVDKVDRKVVALQKKVSGMESSNHKEFKRIHDRERDLARSHVK